MPSRGRTTGSAADAIRDLVDPVVGALGCTCYDVEVAGSGTTRTVRVLLDRAGDGAIDLDLVTEASRAISPLLDDEPSLTGPFLLEVSSPGLERPLRRPDHFAAAVGETVTMTSHTDTGPRRVRGVLVEAGPEGCVVDEDGTRVEVAYAAITKARTVFEWGPPPHERAKKKNRGRAKEKA
jgi:ribosome maturation factor RimP